MKRDNNFLNEKAGFMPFADAERGRLMQKNESINFKNK